MGITPSGWAAAGSPQRLGNLSPYLKGTVTGPGRGR